MGDAFEGVKVELGIMVIGGAGAVKREEEVEPVVATEGHGSEVLKTEEFWRDLKGFLVQRLKDEATGERVWGVFRKAVEEEQ